MEIVFRIPRNFKGVIAAYVLKETRLNGTVVGKVAFLTADQYREYLLISGEPKILEYEVLWTDTPDGGIRVSRFDDGTYLLEFKLRRNSNVSWGEVVVPRKLYKFGEYYYGYRKLRKNRLAIIYFHESVIDELLAREVFE